MTNEGATPIMTKCANRHCHGPAVGGTWAEGLAMAAAR